MARFDLSADQLAVTGDLDSDAEVGFKGALQKLFESGAEVVTVNLSEVTAISSVCVGALVVLWVDLCSDRRRVRLVASPPVKKVLDMTGLSKALGAEAG